MIQFFLTVFLLVLSINPSVTSPMAEGFDTRDLTIAECPRIYMDIPQFLDADTLQFAVRVDGNYSDRKLKYTWVVTKGTMKSGQGTESILLVAKGEERQALTAMVVVCGLPYECQNTISASLSPHAASNKRLQPTPR